MLLRLKSALNGPAHIHGYAEVAVESMVDQKCNPSVSIQR